MGKALVIVESPTKARTITRFLGADYIVESSIGHIRDLPKNASEIPTNLKKASWARIGIHIEDDFAPFYVISKEKQAQVKRLRTLLQDVDALYLATDEDREGESISWHLCEVLKPRVPAQRLVFHEITREAIQKALAHPREIDLRLVKAQEARRILDRLYGYELSPVLWRKIAPALSAGRVQSVAMRMAVERERERISFRPAQYESLQGNFQGDQGEQFAAYLARVDGKRLAVGKDFDPLTGTLRTDTEALLLGPEAAAALRTRLLRYVWEVAEVEQRPWRKTPPAPFTTSTLQQDANRKLRMSARETMTRAQSLYEHGLITYMRTDSTTLSAQAVQAARKEIEQRYGKDYVPAKARVYRTRVKNAQEAHEAIRPAGTHFADPETVAQERNAAETRLYRLIWERTLASQMADARGLRTTLRLKPIPQESSAQDAEPPPQAVFQAGGTVIEFPGYLQVLTRSTESSGEAQDAERETHLPALKRGDRTRCTELRVENHTTQPLPRYTEASLIQALEQAGIGRPSTYASILATILQRAYVFRRGGALVPSFTAFAVTSLLERFFTHLVDLGFTARMEDALDAISRGEAESGPFLKRFYFGSTAAETGAEAYPGLQELLRAEIDPREACTLPFPDPRAEGTITVRVGQYGPYIEKEGKRASLPPDSAPDELTLESAHALLERSSVADVLGKDPQSGKPIYARNGRYGSYVQYGEDEDAELKRKSLLPGQNLEQLRLEDALQLLSLPRSVGQDENGEDILADLGRYGPYLRKGSETRSLEVQTLFTCTLEEAQALFAQPRKYRREQQALRELGAHPESGLTLRILSGRYGPYVSDGTLNASLPRETTPEQMDMERAVELLERRAAQQPKPRRSTTRKRSTPSNRRKRAT